MSAAAYVHETPTVPTKQQSSASHELSKKYSFASKTSSRFQSLLKIRYSNRAFFIFPSTFFPRKLCIYITESPWFSRFILLCIIINCVFLSLYDPLDLESTRNQIISISEFVFQIIFTIEMVLKMFAKGVLFHKFSYFRDYWNILDFVIVTTGFFTFLSLGNNLSVLRAVRLLRPLRAISSLEEMRIIIDSILKSLPMLSNSVVLFVFLLLIYSIVGVQLFKGRLRNRCFDSVSLELFDENYTCALDGPGGKMCPDGYSCLPLHDNVNLGFVSFDNLFWAALNLFSGVSGEEWVFTMYYLSGTITRVIPNIFFMSFILIGGLFVLNLNLVIISDTFSEQLNNHQELRRREKEERRLQMEVEMMTIVDAYVEAEANLVCDTPTVDDDEKIPVQSIAIEAKKSSNHFMRVASSNLSEVSNTSLALLQRIREWRKSVMSFENFKRFANRTYDACASCVDAAPFQKHVQSFVRYIITSHIFVGFFILLTILNTITLGMDHYKMPQSQTDILAVFNYVFIGLFTVEFILKLYGLGLRRFLSDGFNVLDAVIVAMSFVEIAVGSAGGFTVLRTFRLLRILKLARFSESIQKLLRVLVKSTTSAFMITIVLIITIFIFALLGMQLFGGIFGPQYKFEEGSKPRVHWDRFDMALLSSFIVIASEDWPLIQYDTMSVAGTMSFLYFCTLFCVGNYCVLNLFVALLLSQFENDEVESENVGTNKARTSFSFKDSILGLLFFWRQRSRQIPQSYDVNFVNDLTEQQLNLAASVDQHKLDMHRKIPTEHNEDTFVKKPQSAKKFLSFLMDRLLGDYSLFILGDNWVRRGLRRIVNHVVFEIFILILIGVSVVTLIMEDTFRPPDALTSRVLENINLALMFVFVFECILKIIAMGFLFLNGAYMRDPWNVLDLFIVVISILSYAFTNINLHILRTLRLLRALRPLRFVNRFKGLKKVLDALIWSVPSIINVAFVTIMTFIIFGIMGINLMQGTFHHCSNPKWSNRVLCEADGAQWESLSVYNFDNIFNAVLTLFTMQTFEGWVDVLMRGIDGTEPDWAPQRDNRPYIALYFIAYIIVDVFFISNLFVGVLLDQYALRSAQSFHGLITPKQKQWVDIQRVLFDAKPRFKPKPPSVRNYEFSEDGNWAYSRLTRNLRFPIPMLIFNIFFRPIIFLRYILFVIVQNPTFEICIMAVIVMNMLSMALDHYQINQTFQFVLTILNYVWTSIFIVEAVLKIVGLGVVQYFRDWWNVFDFFVTVSGVVGITISFVNSRNVSGFLTVFRLLRVLRLVRLVRVARGIQQLLKTLFLSLPSLFNVGSLLFLLYFIYALIGMRLFARVQYSTWTEERDHGFTTEVHFRDLWTAIQTMIRVSQGEDWPTLMEVAMHEGAPHCSHKRGDCGSYLMAPLFFCSFVLLASLIVLNLFTAVILENFSSVISTDGSVLNETYITHYQKCWHRYDPSMSMYIDATDLPSLVVDLGPPLGFAPTNRNYSREMRNLMRALSDMNHHNGFQLHYQEVLLRLAKYKFGVELPLKMREKFEIKWVRAIPQPVEEPTYTVQQVYAAMKLQQHWRKVILMRKLKEANEAQGPLFQHMHDDFESDSGFSNLDVFAEENYNPDVEDECDTLSGYTAGSAILDRLMDEGPDTAEEDEKPNSVQIGHIGIEDGNSSDDEDEAAGQSSRSSKPVDWNV